MAEGGDSRAPGVTGPCHRHAVKTLGAGRRKRWATRALEGRVTGDAISLPPQEGRGRAVTSSPPARVPNPSTQYLALPRDCGGEVLHLSRVSSGASLTTSFTLVPAGRKAPAGALPRRRLYSPCLRSDRGMVCGEDPRAPQTRPRDIPTTGPPRQDWRGAEPHRG